MTEPASYDLFRLAKRSAIHLETRDAYTSDDPAFAEWKEGASVDVKKFWGDWFNLVADTVARGVEVRRARIVSEPVTDYIKYEHDLTSTLNVAAGEQVRWLPRHKSAGITVPPSDFWIFDEETVVWNHFAGDGSWVGEEISTSPGIAKLCVTSFQDVWQRAIPHDEYALV